MNESVSDKMLAVEFHEPNVDALFAELNQCQLPGAAVGIAIGGKPVYRKGFGLASMELPVILSPTTRLRIFSMTKHFASLAYLLLCEDGRASVDDRVGAHLPELHRVTHNVTMRQLMGNVGGLRDVFDIAWQFSGTGWHVSSAELLALYRSIEDINAEPGTAWIYNNGGFLMLSAAVERITGQSLEDVLRERIFEPIGMYATQLRRFDSDFVPDSATLHTKRLDGGFEKAYLGTALAGEGGMVSTVDDMLRWLAHMEAPAVGSAATWNTMKESQRLANGTSTGYGFGLHIDRYRGIETVSHSGGGNGGNSYMLKVPAAGLDVVIMVNRDGAWGQLLAERILETCLPNLNPVKKLSNGPLTSGIFHSPTTGRVVQLFAEQGLQIASIDGMDMPVETDDHGVLWPAGMFRYTKQSVTVTGGREKPVSIQLSDYGNFDELLRKIPAEEADVSTIVGRYRSDSTGIEAAISQTDDGPRLRTVGRFGSAEHRLEYLADGIWRAKSTTVWWLGGILLLSCDGGGFRFSTYRTRALSFRRIA